MNFNRVVQPQLNFIQTQNNQMQASPIRYDAGINKIAKLPNQGYYIQNGSVQTYFTPMKQVEQRPVPHINITPGPTNSAQTTQLSPFQSCNSKFAAVKGVQDSNSSFNQNNMSSYTDSSQRYPNFGSIQPAMLLDLNNQIPQPPKIQQQSRRIFEDGSQSQKQRLRSNQSINIDNDSSLSNISQRGNLRNSSFIKRNEDKDIQQKQETPIQQRINSIFIQGGGVIKRNSSHDTKVKTLAMVQNQNLNQINRNEMQTLKRNPAYDQTNQLQLVNRQSFGNIQNIPEIKVNIIRQVDMINKNNHDQNQRQIQQKGNININSNNILITNHSNNTLNGQNNNSNSSFFVLNTSQDNSLTKQLTQNNYQNIEQSAIQNQQQNQRQNQQFNSQQTINSQQNQYSKQQFNDLQNQQQNKQQNQLQLLQQQQQNQILDKRELISPAFNSNKFSLKQEIFSFENSQVNIDDQFEIPIEIHSNQQINKLKSNIQHYQNNQSLNFFSSNQNNDIEILGFTVENKDMPLEEQTFQNFKLNEQNYDTFEGLGSGSENRHIREEQSEQQINNDEQVSPNRAKELIAQNNMLRNNLQQLKEIYSSQSVNIGKIQKLQEENSQLKVQLAKLQLQNEEYEKKISNDNKITTQNTSLNYNSVDDNKSQQILLAQIKELQEKNELISKEKFTLLELLFNQEKMYNTLSSELQKQQGSPEKNKSSQIHQKKQQELEDNVKSLQQTIDKLKEEAVEKDNLVQQMQLDLKDSQKQLGLYSDQILVLKEKLNQKADNTRQVNLEQEIIALQTQNKNLMDINGHLQKQQDMLENIKKIKDVQSIKEGQCQRMQFSNYIEKNNENNLQIKPSIGGQVYLQKGTNNKIPITYYKQNHDKIISSNEYYNIKNQNQLLFSTNSIKKFSDQKTVSSNCDQQSCQFQNKK